MQRTHAREIATLHRCLGCDMRNVLVGRVVYRGGHPHVPPVARARGECFHRAISPVNVCVG